MVGQTHLSRSTRWANLLQSCCKSAPWSYAEWADAVTAHSNANPQPSNGLRAHARSRASKGAAAGPGSRAAPTEIVRKVATSAATRKRNALPTTEQAGRATRVAAALAARSTTTLAGCFPRAAEISA